MLVVTFIFVLAAALLATWAIDTLLRKIGSRGTVLINRTSEVDQTEIGAAQHGVPDYVSPIIAYRVWEWEGTKLKSLNGEVWPPGQPLTAECRRHHQAPYKDCECGIYAAKDLRQLRFKVGYREGRIYGEVHLWGTIVEHKLGWRAQFAYPKSLVLPPEMIPLSTKEVECFLQTLGGAYGADIFVATRGRYKVGSLWKLAGAYGNDILKAMQEEKIRLWTKQSGTDPAGLDWLSYRRNEVPENAPIIAHSVWRWDASGLKSYNGKRWSPGQPRAAGCECDSFARQDAVKSLKQLRKMGYSHRWRALYGEVSLWGTVVEHKFGWQAQFAYPKSLVLPPEMIPLSMAEVELLVQALGPYGVDIFLAYREEEVRIWEKTSGIDSAGIDWLNHRWKLVPESSPITAYRRWEWSPLGLTSYPAQQWLPSQATLVANHWDCLEAFVAAKNLNNLREELRRWEKIGIGESSILGEVNLWGNVLEYKHGWRAQFAYPRSLILPPEIAPLDTNKTNQFLASVTAYGADVFVANGQKRVRLWDKVSGYDAAGLDYLRAITSRRLDAAVPVALLTEDQDRQTLLEHHINRARGRIVFSYVGFLTGSGDPVVRQIHGSGAKIVVVDVNPTNLQTGLNAIELIHATAGDIAIFAMGEMRDPKNIVGAMQAGAREYMDRQVDNRDLRRAFTRVLGPQLVEHTQIGDIPTSWMQ